MENLLYKSRDYNNIREVTNEMREKFSQNIAFTVKNPDKTYKDITYKQVLDEADYLGTKLIDLGLKDTRVAIIGKNRYEWVVGYIAVMNGAGVVVPLDKSLPKHEIEISLKRSKVETIICEEKYIIDLKEIIKEGNTNLKNIIFTQCFGCAFLQYIYLSAASLILVL